MIKVVDTKINKKGEPLYYLFMDKEKYSLGVDEGITTENLTLFIINNFKKEDVLKVYKNKDLKSKDILYFPSPNTYGVSQKFKDIFENKLKAEFFKTTIDNYYLMVVNNVVDCVNKEKSKITYIFPDRRCAYERPAIMAFNENMVENELLFSIPEQPLKTFCSERFIKLCEEYEITNIVFEDLTPYS